MKKHRYKLSFFITALLYAVPVLFYLYLFKQAIVSVDKPCEETIELSLSQFVPEAPPVESPEPVQKEQLIEDEPEPEKKVEEEEKPEPETKIEEEEKPDPEPVKEEVVEEVTEEVAAPIVKETPVVEPVKKEEPKPKKKKVKKPVKKPVKKQKKHKKHKKKKRVAHKRQVSGGGSPRHSAAQKNAFLAKIRAKINRAKSYPRIAQRRGMQGVVHARFTILANGHVGNITIKGPKVFCSSARKAIRSAFPVNVKRAPVSFPMVVHLSLRYTLR